jgi:hypothetical protein
LRFPGHPGPQPVRRQEHHLSAAFSADVAQPRFAGAITRKRPFGPELCRPGLIALALTALSYALSPRPKTETPKAAGLDDFDLPTAEEARPIPVVFGTVLLRRPNVVWAGDLKVELIRKKGGKK